MPENTEQLLSVLLKTGMARQHAEHQADELRAETDQLILAAHEAGVNKAQIAKAAGLTRQTVYSVLLRAKAAA